ncbi:hypothetical protein OIO90_005173 [Microbotryomycetes sp. JL221]|nr:hypothetical protein OIO90_005173 [Microbotryomycetes sp. JL221]
MSEQNWYIRPNSLSRFASLIPPKIASPSAIGAPQSAARMTRVVDFYSKLPKGAAPKKSAGANPFARYRQRYFEGDNASGAPFLHAIGVMFLIGYTIDCETATETLLSNPSEILYDMTLTEERLGLGWQLVSTLYDPSTPVAVQQQVQVLLHTIQQTQPQGANLASIILDDTTIDSRVRFFASSTIQTFVEQSTSSTSGLLHQLKEKLIHWLIQSATISFETVQQQQQPNERIVLRKLSSTITSLSFQLVGNTNNKHQEDNDEPVQEWNGWLLQVMSRLAAAGAHRRAILQVLSVVIEQVTRAELVGIKRNRYMTDLSTSMPMVVSSLNSSLTESTDSSETNAALSCFVSFLIAGQLDHSNLSILYPSIIRHLMNESTLQQACTAVEELIERGSGIGSSIGVTRFINRQRTEQLVKEWINSSMIKHIISNSITNSEETNEDEMTLAVFKLVCTICEHFITFLFTDVPTAMTTSNSQIESPLKLWDQPTIDLLQIVLSITLFPGYSTASYNINEMTNGVWLSLQEECTDLGLVYGSGPGREGRSGHEREWHVVNSVFGALAKGLRQRAVRPDAALVRTWPKDVVDAFRTYRQMPLSESLMYCYYILRESMLVGLVQLVEDQLAEAPTSEDSYEQLEATLFCLFAIQEAVSIDEAESLTTLFGSQCFGRLPQSLHPTLRSTALRLVGAYSTWFSNHPNECLLAVQFVVNSLNEPSLASSAAKALVSLSDANRSSLMHHVDSFVNVLSSLEGTMDDFEFVKVLESVSSIVQALPAERIVEPLLTLTNPTITKLGESVNMFAQLPREARELCLQQLAYLTALAKGLSNPESDLLELDTSIDESQDAHNLALSIIQDPRVMSMRDRLSSTIQSIVEIWSNDSEISQTLSDYIRFSISDSITNPVGLNSFDLLNLSSKAVQVTVSSTWLGLSGSLLARLSRDFERDKSINNQYVTRLIEPVEIILTTILNSQPDLNSMDQNPDTVQASMSFALAVIRYFPNVIVQLQTHLHAVIEYARRGLNMQERFSLKAAIDLLIACVQSTVMASESSSTFHSCLVPHVAPLVQAIIQAIAGDVPRSQLVSLSELLHSLLLRLSKPTRTVLKTLLTNEEETLISNWPNEKATQLVKIKFEKSISMARTGKQVRQAVNEFALVCRGLEGSAYGASSMTPFD